jgi:hypothetical protein
MINRSFLKHLSLIFCLVALLSFHPSAFAQDAKPFVGTWNGSLSAAGQEFEIVVEFSLDEKETLQGNIDIPVQGIEDLNLIDILIEGKRISFKIEGVPGDPTFDGELDEAGTIIEGTFSQSGYEGSFTLEKE